MSKSNSSEQEVLQFSNKIPSNLIGNSKGNIHSKSLLTLFPQYLIQEIILLRAIIVLKLFKRKDLIKNRCMKLLNKFLIIKKDKKDRLHTQMNKKDLCRERLTAMPLMSNNLNKMRIKSK
jgi:hypothetical protein